MSPSLLYLKPLRNSNTFLHVIYKSKKKTNLLCILNNVFQYSKIRTRKRNAKKSIKTEKNLESSPFWNPESTELESGIQYSESGIHRVESRIQDCHGFPYMGRLVDVTTYFLSERIFLSKALLHETEKSESYCEYSMHFKKNNAIKPLYLVNYSRF